jgi:hypothetical protein
MLMKIYVVFLLLLASFSVFSQSNTGTSIVIQKVDSVQLDRLIKIENNLTSFHHANRTSQFFIIAGSALTVASVVFYNPYSSSQTNILPILGGISSLVGGIIYLDSYKYLNINKPKKKNVVKTDYDFY